MAIGGLPAGFADDRLLSPALLLRTLWPGLVLLLLLLFFLFPQLLLFVLFLVLLATLVSHARSFPPSCLITAVRERMFRYVQFSTARAL
jgi:hypothetical protein